MFGKKKDQDSELSPDIMDFKNALEEFFCCVILKDSTMFVVNGIGCLLNIIS